MELEWSDLAFEDRRAIFDYIEADSPAAAIDVDLRICGQAQMLADFPELGRPGRVEGTRELVIGHTSCIAAYRIESDRIKILRILHGAQRWPDLLPY